VPMTRTEVAEVGPIRLRASNALSPSPAQFPAKPAEADTDIDAGVVRHGLLAQPLGEADATIQPGIGAFGQSAGDGASHQPDATAPPIAPLHSKLAAERGPGHRNTRGPPVQSYVTRSSSRGVWLFAPNGNEGANN
jgi:hypothetical protein